MKRDSNLKIREVTAAAVSAKIGSDGSPLAAYGDYAYVLGSIQSVLSDLFGEYFEPYVSDDGKEEYWEMLEQDVKAGSPQVQHVSKIFDLMESRAFGIQGDEASSAYGIFPTLRNNVFAYPDWGIALARVPIFRMHGIGAEDFVFAVDDASLKRFLEHARQRRRDLDRRQVTIFTDGPHGMEKELAPITRMVDRSEVIMKEELKRDIYRAIDQFFDEDRTFFKEYELPYKRGILLYGKPGNGKTTLVKSIAGSVKAPVAYWQITENTCSDSIQEVFHAAANLAPMILVIEDIDAMPQRARSYFLNILDGATSKEGIFLIGTTNYPEQIDPALMNRAGRFDRAYEIKLPDMALRQIYLEQKGMGKLLTDDLLRVTAKQTEGFTFAQLNELYAAAALQCHYEMSVDIEKLVKSMKSDLQKGQSMSWLKEDSEVRVGFLVG
ncbi:ATP-binding protein [Paenibacillus sp. CGMCC 1.16610]|uniref:AAA family ATPase n=1 Tax=Paenibacillus anseongense TaxID=2682845 RepID=A0ABW9UCZ7_9BACL|nr:ATP-binding protein [Paenibacillus sp. CGMCC 1.16610]MVQ38044.1 AAA family ATPase [Paenibacillus anseongense]